MPVKLFAGDDYYPRGGYEDFIGYFDGVDAAREHVLNNWLDESCKWAQIVEHDTIILMGHRDCMRDSKWEWQPYVNNFT